MRIANDVTELVGNTPLVRIRKLTEGAKAEVVENALLKLDLADVEDLTTYPLTP